LQPLRRAEDQAKVLRVQPAPADTFLADERAKSELELICSNLARALKLSEDDNAELTSHVTALEAKSQALEETVNDTEKKQLTLKTLVDLLKVASLYPEKE